MDPLKNFKRCPRANQSSQQSTPATQSSTTDAPEPRRHGRFSFSRLPEMSDLQVQDDTSDDQGTGFDEDDGDQIAATIDQNSTPAPQRRGSFSQKAASKKSALQPQDDRSNDQGMDPDGDDDDPISTAIDQVDTQVRTAKFDETDDEDTDKSPEELALMKDPSMYQMRKGAREWARVATPENVWEEINSLVARLVNLNEVEEERGLDEGELRDRETWEYILKWARKRYLYDNPEDIASADQTGDDNSDQINATIDQNDKQVRNAAFDETDSEDTGESPEDMEDPDLCQMRRESRQWARKATSEDIWSGMGRLVAFDTDLDDKKENRGKYAKTKQRGLNANDRRDRKICRYRLKWARKRYRHDNPSSENSFDADATAEEPPETAPEGISSGPQASPDQQHGFASSPGPSSNQQSTPSSPDSNASESRVRGIIRETKKSYLVQWEDSWIKCLPAEHKPEKHSIISKVVGEKIVEENKVHSRIRWRDSWIPKSYANNMAIDAWEEEKARQKRQREEDDGSDIDAPDESGMEGRDDD
jgi:hypothetical protein